MAKSALIVNLNDDRDPLVEIKTYIKRGEMEIRIFPHSGAESYVLIKGSRQQCQKFLAEFDFQVNRATMNMRYEEGKSNG